MSATSVETDQGGWTVPGAPAASGANTNDWIRSDRSLDVLGLRPRGRDGAETRAKLIGDAMGSFGVTP